jgi:hypothetical protein
LAQTRQGFWQFLGSTHFWMSGSTERPYPYGGASDSTVTFRGGGVMELGRLIGYLLAFACLVAGVEGAGKAYMDYFAKEATKSQKQQFSLSKWNRKLMEPKKH